MISLRRELGVGGRLLLAFGGISGFAVLAAAAAFLAFTHVGALVDRVTQERMPAAFAALAVSRQAERLAAAAPQLLAPGDIVHQMRTDRILRTSLAELDRLLLSLESAERDGASLSPIADAVEEIRRNVAQVQSLFPDPFRNRQLAAARLAEAEGLLRANQEIASRLTLGVDRFVESERAQIAQASAEVAATQRTAGAVLAGVGVLSLISAALIVWLYVQRSIVGRLSALTGSMLAIAQGNLQAPLPSGGSRDEIGAMGEALRVFRDTALEKERLARLRRFLAPEVAELVVSSGDDSLLDSHRRDVAVLFCDLRGFTAFAETSEPEEVMALLRSYHDSLGRLVRAFAGTLERFTGDGLIVLFNDPLPCPDPCLTAARLAIAMRASVEELAARWQRLGTSLGFGIGIAYGYATLGRVGFEGRFDYTAIGSVVNLAARLCERAQHGQILIDGKVQAAIDGRIATAALGEFTPKGFSRPVALFDIPPAQSRGLAESPQQVAGG